MLAWHEGRLVAPAFDFRLCTHARVHTRLFLLRWCHACTTSILKYTCNDAVIAGAGVCSCPVPPHLHSLTSGHRPPWPPSTACSHRQELASAAKMVQTHRLFASFLSVHRWSFLAPHASTWRQLRIQALNHSAAQCSQGSSWVSRLLIGVRQCNGRRHHCWGRSETALQPPPALAFLYLWPPSPLAIIRGLFAPPSTLCTHALARTRAHVRSCPGAVRALHLWLTSASVPGAVPVCCRLPLGLAAGVNTLVANALGAGSAHNASRVFSTGVRAGVGLQFSIAVGAVVAGPALIRVLCQGERSMHVCAPTCARGARVRALGGTRQRMHSPVPASYASRLSTPLTCSVSPRCGCTCCHTAHWCGL